MPSYVADEWGKKEKSEREREREREGEKEQANVEKVSTREEVLRAKFAIELIFTRLVI